jgi:hypothetical protein
VAVAKISTYVAVAKISTHVAVAKMKTGANLPVLNRGKFAPKFPAKKNTNKKKGANLPAGKEKQLLICPPNFYNFPPFCSIFIRIPCQYLAGKRVFAPFDQEIPNQGIGKKPVAV